MAPSILLVSDLDDTLTGDAEAMSLLADRLRSDDVTLVVNSSRPADDVRDDSDIARLPVHAIAAGLGTQIEWAGETDQHWESRFGWMPRSRLAAILARFGPAHEPHLQAPAKVSHSVPRTSWPAATRAVRDLDSRLMVITSGESNFDVVPRAAGKANAARYLALRHGVTMDWVVTAGDSEPDAQMLLLGSGIAVGNATPQLLQLVAGHAYCAVADYAAGVLEGLDHYRIAMEACADA